MEEFAQDHILKQKAVRMWTQTCLMFNPLHDKVRANSAAGDHGQVPKILYTVFSKPHTLLTTWGYCEMICSKYVQII